MGATIEQTSDREHLRSERVEQLSGTLTGSRHRARLLEGLPVTERRLQLAGVSTAVLENGWAADRVSHGPGDFAGDVDAGHPSIGDYTPRHRPGSAGARYPGRRSRLDADGIRAWLSGLIERTCLAPPVLVAHVIANRRQP